MAWISVHQQLRDHRKTRALYRELGISRPEAIGTLVLLWTWAIDNCDQDGKLICCTVEDIADATFWAGDSKVLYDALISTGWLDEKDGEIFLHDWYDFNKPFYDYTNRKEKDKQRKRENKSAGDSTEIPAENPPEFHDSPSPSPSPSQIKLISTIGAREEDLKPEGCTEKEVTGIYGEYVKNFGEPVTAAYEKLKELCGQYDYMALYRAIGKASAQDPPPDDPVSYICSIARASPDGETITFKSARG